MSESVLPEIQGAVFSDNFLEFWKSLNTFQQLFFIFKKSDFFLKEVVFSLPTPFHFIDFENNQVSTLCQNDCIRRARISSATSK